MSDPNDFVHRAQYLTFYLSGEEYAVGILRVREIIAFGTLTKVPRTPPYIRGVINLRGSVVPVIDLAVRFGQPATSLLSRTCVVIIEMKAAKEVTTMGILTDSVGEVIELSNQDILPTPHFGAPVNINFLQGIARISSKFVLILDIDSVLSATAEMDSQSLASEPLARDRSNAN